MLTSILWTISSLVGYKLMFIKDHINGVGSCKVFIEANGVSGCTVIIEVIIIVKQYGMEFFTSKAKLTLLKLRQAFYIVPKLHNFDLAFYIEIRTDISSYAISRILS